VTTRIDQSSKVVAGSNQVSTAVEGETVILELEHGTYYGLDPVGSRIWVLIQEPSVVSDVCETIVSEYDVEPERCAADTVRLLQHLREAGLVEVVA
jgi:hypothetical protein